MTAMTDPTAFRPGRAHLPRPRQCDRHGGQQPDGPTTATSTLCCLIAMTHRYAALVWWEVVRCGVVGCDVVRCGVVWCGAVWCGVWWCGVVWWEVVWWEVVWWEACWEVGSERGAGLG